jgi:dihydropteroate synthase
MVPQEFDNWLRQGPPRVPLVMGVLNITPDSFSDGGRFASEESAVAHAQEMAKAGADLIDVGGESTRPGSQPVPAEEQIRRVVPVIRRIASLPLTLSIDTTRSAVAEAALDAGAALVNDISSGRDDPAMLPLVARRRVPIVLMHMQGTPATMQDNPTYRDVMAEVIEHLRERMTVARAASVEESRILLDPGIGFGKTMYHNLELIRRQRELLALGRPVVIGTSRKGFIGRITGETEPSQRLFGTAACVAWAVANGAAIVRVHDVRPMKQVVAMTRAILNGPSDAPPPEILTPQ